jgi:hypothetical protein
MFTKTSCQHENDKYHKNGIPYHVIMPGQDPEHIAQYARTANTHQGDGTLHWPRLPSILNFLTMPKLARKIQKIFGGDIPDDENNTGISQFGSLAANPGDVKYTKNPDEIQALPGYGQGWLGATVRNNVAPLQDMNALQFLFSRQLAYLMQAGIPEWNATQDYYLGSFCNAEGTLYISQKNDNMGNSVTNTNWWRPFGLVSIGTKEDRPKSPIDGSFYYDTTISRMLMAYGSKWTTIEGAPGDIKDVYAPKLDDALGKNPGWEYLPDWTAKNNKPDASGCVLACANSQHAVGSKTGVETANITVEQLPSHSHTARITTYARSGGGQIGKVADSGSNATQHVDFTTNASGLGRPVSLMQPTFYVWKLIKV